MKYITKENKMSKDMRMFTTGAHIEPLQLADGRWVWYVRGFEDDTYDDDGELADTVGGISKTREGLLDYEE